MPVFLLPISSFYFFWASCYIITLALFFSPFLLILFNFPIFFFFFHHENFTPSPLSSLQLEL